MLILNLTEDIKMVTAVVTSLIASVVFWLSFEGIPSYLRYRKMRPIVEDNLYWISFYLLMYLQCAVLHSRNTASYFQYRIRAGDISEEEYGMFLNTKCLNESYIFDESSKGLLIVGDKLKKFSDLILCRVDNAYRYTQYTKTEEYFLLEEIVKRISRYEYCDNASVNISGMVLRPKNPSIYYMHKTFKELNDLLLELNEKITHYRYLSRNETQKYADLVLRLRKGKHISNADIRKLERKYKYAFLFEKLYRKDREQSARYLEKYLYEEKNGLVDIRSGLEFIIDDKPFVEILKKVRGEKEVNDFYNIITNERNYRKKLYDEAKAIRKYYEQLEKV